MMQGINTFTNGMQGGIDPALFAQDSYSYMLNGYMVSKDNHGFVITNIKGTVLVAEMAENEVPIGVCEYRGIMYILTHYIDLVGGQYNRLYSYYGSDGTQWIESLLLVPCGPNNEGFSSPINVLGFSRTQYVEIEAKDDYDSSVNLYLCNKNGKNAIINTGVNKNGIYTDRLVDLF